MSGIRKLFKKESSFLVADLKEKEEKYKEIHKAWKELNKLEVKTSQ